MERIIRIGVIGYGNMASAIVSGALRAGLFAAADTVIFDPSEVAHDRAAELGLSCADSIDSVIKHSDVILLSVKPQQLEEVLDSVGVSCDGKCFISIVTGASTNRLKARLNRAYVVRVMPNTPIMLGFGASAISLDDSVPAEYRDFVLRIFSGSGVAEIIDESLMNAIISVSGSSPAYFFKLAELIAANAEKHGISSDIALKLFAATMEGASHMLTDSGKTPAELRKQVCSPGGTTLAALNEMTDKGFDDAFVAGLEACLKRAEELGK